MDNILLMYLAQIEDWEYCYCQSCESIRFALDLEATEKGIRCAKCGSYELEQPGWVDCPHHKGSAIKCPRSGKGIKKYKYENVCQDRCQFRLFQKYLE